MSHSAGSLHNCAGEEFNKGDTAAEKREGTHLTQATPVPTACRAGAQGDGHQAGIESKLYQGVLVARLTAVQLVHAQAQPTQRVESGIFLATPD